MKRNKCKWLGLSIAFIQIFWIQTLWAKSPKPLTPWEQCLQTHLVPKSFGNENPPNRSWPRPLMGSHKPSPMDMEKAKQACQKLGVKK